MAWFKHDSGARRDIKIRLVMKQYGSLGIGVYWQLVEILADERELMIDINKVPLEVLSDEVKLPTDQFKSIVEYFVSIGLFDSKSWSVGILYCPALESRLDEYRKRLKRIGVGTVSEHKPNTVRHYKKRIEEKRLEEIRKDIYMSAEEIKNTWNETKNLPKILDWSVNRLLKLKARLQEPAFVSGWKEAIQKMDASTFITGGGNTGWRGDINWFLANDTNYLKVLEGKYDNPKYDPYLKKEPVYGRR